MTTAMARRVFGLAWVLASSGSGACGYEDPSSASIRRGMLNFVYPNALHAGTAARQAQAEGRLPLEDAAARHRHRSPDEHAREGRERTEALLNALGRQLGSQQGDATRPPLSIVLLGPMLWSRVEARDGMVRVATHVDGPALGDVVAVTDALVVQAIVGGTLGFAEALDRGLVRLYGASGPLDAAQAWLRSSAPSRSAS